MNLWCDQWMVVLWYPGREFSVTHSVCLILVDGPPSEGLMPMTVITTPDATLLDNLEIDLGVSRGNDEDQVDAEATLLDDESEWSQIRHRRGPTLEAVQQLHRVRPSLLEPMPWIVGGMQRWPATMGANASRDCS